MAVLEDSADRWPTFALTPPECECTVADLVRSAGMRLPTGRPGISILRLRARSLVMTSSIEAHASPHKERRHDGRDSLCTEILWR